MENINKKVDEYYVEDFIADSEEVNKSEDIIHDDSDDFSEDPDESEEPDSNGKTRIIRPKRQAMINFGDKCRARFVENDANIFFERKVQGKFEPLEGEESTDDNFKVDGYFGTFDSLVKYVLSINVKEKLLHKKEINNLEEIKMIMKESEQEMKALANEIIKAIKNNEIFAEITDELMDK